MPAHHRNRVIVRLARIGHSKGRLRACGTDIATLDIGRLLQAERDDLDVFTGFIAHTCHIFVVGVQDDRAACGDGLDELALGPGDILQRA